MPVGMGEQAFNVLLRFVVDKKTLQQVETGTKSLQEVMVEMEGAGQQLALSAYRLQPALDAQIKKTAELQNAWWKTQRVVRASAFVFTSITAAGVGALTPIVALATKYAEQMEKAEDATDPIANKWLGLRDNTDQSKMRIGKVAAEQLLPVYEKIANVMDKAATFVENNPQIINALVNIGAVVASVGVLGGLVTAGIKLVVDIKFVAASAANLLASEQMMKAAKENMLAAIMMDQAGDTDAVYDILNGPDFLTKSKSVGNGIGITGLLGNAAILAVATTVIAVAGPMIGNWAAKLVHGEDYKEQGLGDAARTAYRIASLPSQFTALGLAQLGGPFEEFAANIGKWTNNIDDLITKLFHLDEQAEDTATAIDSVTASLKGHEKEAEIVKAYEQMRKEDLEAEKKYLAEREAIIRDANARTLGIIRSLSNDIGTIKTNLGKTLDSLKANKQAADTEAFAKYSEERRSIVESANQAILQSEQDLKQKLLELEMEHNRNLWDLVGERDALGIVEENRRYAEEVAKAEDEHSREMSRRRKETSDRLRELDNQYAQEKARRNAEYAAKVKEEQAKAAAEIAERRKKAAEEYREAVQARIQKLQQLKDEYMQERQRRREAFIAMVRDLDASLLGEQRLKQAHYQRMLADAEAFLRAYRSRLPTYDPWEGGNAFPKHADGDYVSGRITTGERGMEFLLSNRTVKAAEMAVGGRLTQQKILAGLTGGAQQTIYVQMSNGVTLMQVSRMLKEHTSSFAQELAESLGT